jgi:predicted lysophospholipase L1 biosynthesis ABC-type transport system permease subunit
VLPEAASAFPLNQLQIWVPPTGGGVYLIRSQLNNGGYFQAIARLRPGVSLEQTADAMNVIAAGDRAAKAGNVNAPSQIEIVPLLDDAVGAQRQSYLLLFGAVGCVLVIACAKVANLLLARFAGRRREIAARFALGAVRGDVVRELVTESMLVAVLGGGVGVRRAHWVTGSRCLAISMPMPGTCFGGPMPTCGARCRAFCPAHGVRLATDVGPTVGRTHRVGSRQ